MIIKKFTGKTENEAVEAAKKELGDNVVIMNVRQVKPKGLFAMFKAKQVEVTVALEEEPAKPPKREATSGEVTPTGASVSQAAPSGGAGILSGQSSIEKKLDSLQTLLESQLKQNENAEKPAEKEEPAVQTEKPASVEAEGGKGADAEQEKFIRLLYNTMIENEVAEKYVNQILEDVDKNRKPNMPFDYLLANIYQKIILKFGKSEGILPADKGPRVVLFIGPTGVGKTTTIAKLASIFSMEQKKKIALLTADTYRIAATEQLRTYAQILEVPFRVVYTAEETKDAVEAFNEYDYIFVDTAGHSHRNAELLANMKMHLDAVAGIAQMQVFLVLSATTKYKDLLKIVDNYKEVTNYQLIFTKLDETTTVGNLLNVKLHADTPIAYITCGQNVPQDIEPFNPQKTVKQLLGGKA